MVLVGLWFAWTVVVKGVIRNLGKDSGVLLQVLSMYPIAFPTNRDSMPLTGTFCHLI